MKKSKVAIFCLICTLLCTLFCVPAAADIGTEAYEKTMEVLQRVGVLEASAAGEAGDAVSRAEFTAWAVRAMGMNVSAGGTGKSGFADVPDAHPYAGVVEQARQLGLIDGNGNTLFYPDNKISYQEAAKILVNVTGYHRKLSDRTQSSYMAMANQLGIMRATGSPNYAMAARRDVLYKMIENALDVDVLKQTGFGSEVRFESQKGQTVMSEYLKVGKYKGVVTATPYTTYNGPSNLQNNQMEINSATYTVSINRATVENLLGHQVIYYVDIADPSEDYPTILLLRDNMPEGRVITVNAEDIKSDTTPKTLYYYTYSDSGAARSESAAIEENANVIYNGVYFGKAHMLQDSDMQPAMGSVTLVDTDGSGRYDLVKINNILTIVVESANSTERTVSDYYKRATLKIDDSAEVRILKAGREITFDELKAWDVLAVKEDREKTTVEIEVTSSRVNGTVKAIGDDTITVDEQELELAESLKTFLEQTGEAKYQVSLGDSGSFYLDADGKIAAIDAGGKSGTGGNYGYLIKWGMGSGLSTKCQMKVLTKSNEIVTLDAAEKLTIDGVSGQNGTALNAQFNKLENARPAGSYSGTEATITAAYTKQNYVIVYKTNEAGLVTEVDTVIDNPAERGLGLTIDYPAANKRYKSGYKFSGKTAINNFNYSASTVMFNIPMEENADEKSYTAVNDFTHDQFFDVAAYDRINGQVSVVCNFKSSGGGSSNELSTNVNTLNTVGIVQKVTKTAGEDNETATKVYLVNGGKETSYTFVPDKIIPELKFGDVIVYNSDSLGRIDAMKILFQPTEDKQPFLEGAASAYEACYGMVYEKFPNVVTMLTDLSKKDNAKLSDLEPYMINSFSRIYLVDMKEEEVRLGSTADIFSYEMDPENASMMFLKLYYDNPKEAIIFKWK